jgi:hypothetical protein
VLGPNPSGPAAAFPAVAAAATKHICRRTLVLPVAAVITKGMLLLLLLQSLRQRASSRCKATLLLLLLGWPCSITKQSCCRCPSVGKFMSCKWCCCRCCVLLLIPFKTILIIMQHPSLHMAMALQPMMCRTSIHCIFCLCKWDFSTLQPATVL